MISPRTRLAALFAALPASLFAQTTWDYGANPDQNWSTLTNWSTDASPAGTAVVFGSTGTTANATTVGNIVDTDLAVSALTYNHNTTGWQVTQIGAGRTLNVSGAFLVGGNSAVGSATLGTRAAFTGTGALSVNDSAATFSVTNNSTGSGGVLNAVLDLSNLSTFTATVNAFRYGNGTNGAGTIYLADNSTITASTLAGGGTGTYSNWNSNLTNRLVLGSTTVLHVDTITFATGRTRGSVGFRSAGSGAANTTAATTPELTIRGSAGGTSRAALSVGAINEGIYNPAGVYTSTADFSAGSVDAMVSTLTVGYALRGLGGSNSYTGKLILGAGNFDATSVIIGQQGGNTGDGASTATLGGHLQITDGNFTAGSVLLANSTGNVNNAVSGILDISGAANVSVTGDVILAKRTNVISANVIGATINISGGFLSVGGHLTEGTNANANAISSTVNLSGGVLDMTGGNVAVDTFNFTGGTLRNVGTFTGNLNAQNNATLGFTGVNGAFSSTVLAGGLTLGASANLAIALADGFTPVSGFTLLSNDGLDSIAGTFATVNGSAFGAGNTFTLTNDMGSFSFALDYVGGDGNDLVLTLGAIPEPSAGAALAGAAALGLVAGRRRRRSP